jgi:P4 family phage/plasmid primase-like protien
MTDPRQALFAMGYKDLVCVAPPGAPVSPTSGLREDDLGKRPAKSGAHGWYGYDWIRSEPTATEVDAWVRWGANVGLRGEKFPALDIDVLDHMIVKEIRTLAIQELGPAPVRVGRAPKELLVYRLEGAPFKRMAVKLPCGGLVEFLGDQRQYLVYGLHPSGVAYKWLRTPLWEIEPSRLASVSSEAVTAFLELLAERYGGTVVGRLSTTTSEVDQEHLEAPSMEALGQLVAVLPNTFSERDDYITIGHAIKAAGQEDEEGAFAVFAEWCSRWDGGNDPDTVRADWRRMHPPFRVGWSYLVDQAPSSFCELVHVFEADPDYEPAQLDSADEILPVDFTDDWCAERVLPILVDTLRYDWPNDRWHVWDGSRWAHADMGQHERAVLDALRKLARQIRPMLSKLEGPAKQKGGATLAKLGNVSTLTGVSRILTSHSKLVVGTDAFDTEDMELNTPSGTVDLTTGELRPHRSEAMHSKSTAVSPRPGAAPLWNKFIKEVTGDDPALARFMQKTAGYALTGVRREQTLNFVWGPGGNGKSVFVDALMGVLGDYAATAPMDTFASSKGDKHPTDLAGLMGARLVTATETQSGRSWDEQRLKAITGGDRMRARFMRQDFVEFTPRFKLILVGNHEPQIDNVDDAMRRRIHIVPFTYKPALPDLNLPEKLRAEYPQILQWMIEGCIMWQNEGLVPPECVLAQTQQYFDEEDQPRRWLEECTRKGGYMSCADAYRSWQLWTSMQGEPAGTQREFTKGLRPLAAVQGFEYKRVGPATARQRGWSGISLLENPNDIQGDLT